jgi:hypothetical protein
MYLLGYISLLTRAILILFICGIILYLPFLFFSKKVKHIFVKTGNTQKKSQVRLKNKFDSDDIKIKVIESSIADYFKSQIPQFKCSQEQLSVFTQLVALRVKLSKYEKALHSDSDSIFSIPNDTEYKRSQDQENIESLTEYYKLTYKYFTLKEKQSPEFQEWFEKWVCVVLKMSHSPSLPKKHPDSTFKPSSG